MGLIGRITRKAFGIGNNGLLARDNDDRSIQAPSQGPTQDNTGTPEKSPKSSITTTPQAFIAQDEAVFFKIKPVGDDAWVSYGSAFDKTDGNGYWLVSDGDVDQYPVKAGQTVYVRAASGTITDLFFYFGTTL